jgi:hypothetical protein
MKDFILLLLFYYFVSIQKDISRHTVTVNCIQHNSNSNSHDNDDDDDDSNVISKSSSSSSSSRVDNIVNNNHYDSDHDDNYLDDNNHDNNDSNNIKKIIDDTSTTTTIRGKRRGTIVNCSNQLLCNQGHGYSIMNRNQTILFINLRLSNDHSYNSRVMVCVTYDNNNNNIHKQSSSQSNSQLSCKQNIYHDIYIINQLFNHHEIIKIHIIYYIDNIYHHYDQKSYYITQLSTSPSISEYLSIRSPSLYGAVQYKRLEINFVKKQILLIMNNNNISHHHHQQQQHINTNNHNHHDDSSDVDDSSDMMLFHVHGVTTSELSSSQQTIESSIYDIEPGSWFYTITPIQHIYYTNTKWKKTTTTDGIHDNVNNSDDDHDDDSNSDYHFDYGKDDVTRTGYKSSGYIEFLFSPQEIHEQRRFPELSTRFKDSSRRFNDDLRKTKVQDKVDDGEDDRLKYILQYCMMYDVCYICTMYDMYNA